MPSIKPNKSKNIYFDNAATSFPKPESVIVAVADYITRIGGNPGRSGHLLSSQAGEIVFICRELLARMFGVKNIMKVIFTSNATDALNLAMLGFLKKGDHAVTTSMEHNSVIRPLKEIENKGIISLKVLHCDKQGHIDLNELEDSLHKVSLVVVNHVSNVFGTAQDLRAIAEICRKKNVPLLADCAQSAGVLDIDLARDGIDMIAVAGHKGLYGPTGTGALIISDSFDAERIEPIKYGGTGSFSEHMTQPMFLPDRFESGTLNAAGIAGLAEGIRHISSVSGGLESVRMHEQKLKQHFLAKCKKEIDTFVEYVSADDAVAGTLSFNLEGLLPSEVAEKLANDFNIMCRAGLHCAPLAHQTMGTFPNGTVRFSFGIFNTMDEIDRAVAALKKISEG